MVVVSVLWVENLRTGLHALHPVTLTEYVELYQKVIFYFILSPAANVRPDPPIRNGVV